mmetsp:Transcript_108846/g.307795  ORF Transcript_108846/g.307795 Transcript_108846/m.307795 type:complete len:265 (-) Transcript_108846:650-1444(-)
MPLALGPELFCGGCCVGSVVAKFHGRPGRLHGVPCPGRFLISACSRTRSCIEICVCIRFQGADGRGHGRIPLPLLHVVAVPQAPELLAGLTAGLARERDGPVVLSWRTGLRVARLRVAGLRVAGRLRPRGLGAAAALRIAGQPRPGSIDCLPHRLVDVCVGVGLGLRLVRGLRLGAAVAAGPRACALEGLHGRNLVVVLRPLGLEKVRGRLRLQRVGRHRDAPLLPGPVALGRPRSSPVCGRVGRVPARRCRGAGSGGATATKT